MFADRVDELSSHFLTGTFISWLKDDIKLSSRYSNHPLPMRLVLPFHRIKLWSLRPLASAQAYSPPTPSHHRPQCPYRLPRPQFLLSKSFPQMKWSGDVTKFYATIVTKSSFLAIGISLKHYSNWEQPERSKKSQTQREKIMLPVKQI